jgi:hypothetical protein
MTTWQRIASAVLTTALMMAGSCVFFPRPMESCPENASCEAPADCPGACSQCVGGGCRK